MTQLRAPAHTTAEADNNIVVSRYLLRYTVIVLSTRDSIGYFAAIRFSQVGMLSRKGKKCT